MIRIAIVGYGKMGKMIESLIKKDSHFYSDFTVTGVYDIDNPLQSNYNGLAEVAIEFTTPASVISNVEFLSSRGVNVVCGTTGWYDKIENIREIIQKNGTGFIYASNFSIGVNLFFHIVKSSAELMQKQTQYDVSIEETHHTAKLDKPSGTALRIAEYITERSDLKKKIVNDKLTPLPDELNITSIRKQDVVGNHRVVFDSNSDSITLEHNAKSRQGFAEGALLAARYIYQKKGFFRFEDIFTKLIK
ncbi:MAG: 4-hydroxy-tetrahydrodipicolinate reductase [Ignavibacteria bacterium]|nr:4-hydroxy-tetrahydrodipicolinate reductase [Ignavibacteria bacterium]